MLCVSYYITIVSKTVLPCFVVSLLFDETLLLPNFSKKNVGFYVGNRVVVGVLAVQIGMLRSIYKWLAL